MEGYSYLDPSPGYHWTIYNFNPLETDKGQNTRHLTTSAILGVEKIEGGWKVTTRNSTYIIERLEDDR